MHHNRLGRRSSCVTNLAVLVFGVTDGWWTVDGIALGTLSDVVLANFALAILIRQQYVINLLFWLATRAPTTWPLRVRWTLAKVYHFGGLHVGGAVAGTLWFLALVGAEIYHVARGLPGVTPADHDRLMLHWSRSSSRMALMARPSYRARAHDTFERMHRFGGWTALGLFWASTLLAVLGQRGDRSAALALAQAPSIWVLARAHVQHRAALDALAAGPDRDRAAVVARRGGPVRARPQAVRRLVDRDQPQPAPRVALVRQRAVTRPRTASA